MENEIQNIGVTLAEAILNDAREGKFKFLIATAIMQDGTLTRGWDTSGDVDEHDCILAASIALTTYIHRIKDTTLQLPEDALNVIISELQTEIAQLKETIVKMVNRDDE